MCVCVCVCISRRSSRSYSLLARWNWANAFSQSWAVNGWTAATVLDGIPQIYGATAFTGGVSRFPVFPVTSGRFHGFRNQRPRSRIDSRSTAVKKHDIPCHLKAARCNCRFPNGRSPVYVFPTTFKFTRFSLSLSLFRESNPMTVAVFFYFESWKTRTRNALFREIVALKLHFGFIGDQKCTNTCSF